MKTVLLPRGLAPAVALVTAAGLAWGALVPAAAQDAMPGADEPTEVVYVDEDGNELARVTVDEIVDPVADAPDGVAPADGERLVLVPLTVENTGEEDLPLDPVTFLLRDEGGFLYGLDDDLQDALAEDAATPAAGGDDAAEAPFEAGDLAPGEEREGVIGFAVPEEAELAQVIFVPETGRLLILADLEEDEDATATATPRSPASARATATSATTAAAAATTPTPAPVAEPTAPAAPTAEPEPEPAVEATDEPTAEVAAEPTAEAATTPDADGDGVPDTGEGDTVGDPTATVTETAAETAVAAEVTAPASEPTLEPTTTAPDAVAEPTLAPVVGADSDADGLSDDDETALGSDPADADTDADGLPDGDEVGTYGTSPVDGDSDGDGIADIDEVIGSAAPIATAGP